MALNVRLDTDLHRRAVEQAEVQHRSLNSLISEALSEYLDRRDHRGRVGESMDKMLPRYSDTLRRLGGVTEHLDLDDALIIARAALGGQEVEVRDPGLLGSALYRPQTVAFGVEVYPTLARKAGALLHSLVMNHALFDGNKRLGWAAVLVFADLNGCEIDLTEDAAYELVMAVARGELDADAIADRLRRGGVDR